MNYKIQIKRINLKILITVMILTLIIAFNTIIISDFHSHAAEPKESLNHGIRSYGRIEIDQNDNGSPEAIFEAQDIYNLAQKCK